ncbi:MAG: type IV pilus secretin PilQ [Terriglobia bacterium]
MRRKAILSLTMTWLILGMASVAQSRQTSALPQASLKAVTTAGPVSANQLLLRIEGKYSFQAVQATADTVLVDLKGVRVDGVARDGQWATGLLSGYHLLQFTDANGQPVIRVQVNLKGPEPFTLRQEPAGLRLLFGPETSATPAAAAEQPAAPLPRVAAPVVPLSQALPRETPRVVTATVAGISIKAGPAGETFIDITTTRPTAYSVLHLANPSRLVLDLEGARNGTRQRAYSASSEVLKGVRVGQFREGNPSVVRVVADLIGVPVFDVHAQPGGVRVELKPRPSVTPAAASPPTEAAPSPARADEKPVQVAGVVFAPVVTADPAVAAPKQEAVTSEGKAAQAGIDVHNALPVAAGSPEVSAAPKPEAPAEAPEALQAARAAMTLVGSSEVISAAPLGQAPGSAQEQPKYTGEPISLNLKDVDLKDFFRLIHEISGLNIIVDPNVTGSVTLVLDAVPWDQALDIVLKNNRLGKTLEGNVLRIARVETLTAEQESVAKLAAAREEAQPLVTVFRPVNYAKASTIATMLKSWVGGGALSKRGNILVDERTNTLIVSDIQTQIPVIESIITRLDKKAKQVQIEARIVQATADFSRELGVALSGGLYNKSGTTNAGGASGPGSVVTTGIPASGGIPAPTIGVTPAAATGFGAIAVTNVGARYFISAALAAAETRGQAKTISRPSIVTQNNVPGTVMQGTQVPIQTTINNTISIQYVNATLTLKVTPQVTEDGNIFLDVNVNNASLGTVYVGVNPTIDTQQATTQVLVPDGGTVVFGGVTITQRSRSATQVPLLGSIPLIGNLFKSSKVLDSDKELLFFLSPKVLPG